MTCANGRLAYDADSHIMETPDWVARHADPAIRERLVPLGLGKAGEATTALIEGAMAHARPSTATTSST